VAFEHNEAIGLRVNLDEIVSGLGDWRDDKLQLEAGKQAVRLVRQYLSEGVSFHQETTLAGKSIFRTIREAKKSGFEVVMYYVGVDTPDIAKARVYARVQSGGHGIEDAVVEKRFTASLEHLKLAVGLCDAVHFYDNSGESLRYVLSIERGVIKEREATLPSWLLNVFDDLQIGSLEYRNCLGSIQYSAEDGCYYGKILGINDLYTYEGSNLSELETAFHEAVDEHLDRK
jgi:predicted ABC-type ATPase